MLKRFLIILILNSSCVALTPRIPLPPDPVLESVKVHNNSISGDELTHVINNHLTLWRHIEKLKALGNFKK